MVQFCNVVIYLYVHTDKEGCSSSRRSKRSKQNISARWRSLLAFPTTSEVSAKMVHPYIQPSLRATQEPSLPVTPKPTCYSNAYMLLRTRSRYVDMVLHPQLPKSHLPHCYNYSSLCVIIWSCVRLCLVILIPDMKVWSEFGIRWRKLACSMQISVKTCLDPPTMVDYPSNAFLVSDETRWGNESMGKFLAFDFTHFQNFRNIDFCLS